jgi:signal transduction histidine kinase
MNAEPIGALDEARTGVGVFGRDGQLLLHTPRFVELLGLGDSVVSPGRLLEEILVDLRRTHPIVEHIPPVGLRCQKVDARWIEIAFEKLIYDRCCVSVTDVSEQRQIEHELRRAQAAAEAASQAKSRFLATMSHELRTPLNAVIGFSDALTREAAPGAPAVDPARITEFSGAIQQAGQHLLSLINNILDVARIESGRFDLVNDIIDVSHMLLGCARTSRQAADAAEVSIDAAIRPNIPSLRADERRLRQVLAHLFNNAIKFTHAGGGITVGAELAADTGDLLLFVRDSGIGIPEEDLERVFEPFHQLDAGLARRTPGAGLGLYFCRALVQAHGGALKLDSREGQGTTAIVRLPKSRLVSGSSKLELPQESP